MKFFKSIFIQYKIFELHFHGINTKVLEYISYKSNDRYIFFLFRYQIDFKFDLKFTK